MNHAEVITDEEISSTPIQQQSETNTVSTSEEDESDGRDLSQIPPLEVTENFLQELDASDCLDLKLTSSGARIIMPNGRFKNISLKSLAKAIFDDTGIDTGFLPLLGSNYSGIRRYIQAGNKHILLLEASPTPVNLKYDSGYLNSSWMQENEGNYTRISDSLIEIPNVPFPFLFMGISLEETSDGTMKYNTSKLYAAKTPVFTETTRLYHFPFGNIYEDHRVCWGNMEEEVRRRNFSTILQAGALLDQFITSVYNQDLYRPRRSHLPTRENGRALADVFVDLSRNHQEYPYSTLHESLTVSELISLLKNN